MPAPREPVGPQEYTQLFHTYYPQTVRYILALLTRRGHPPDQGLAEELAQEAFLLLWEKRAEAANPVGWLYTTAANLVWNQLRSHRRWSARLAQVEPEYLEALPGPPPSDDLLDLEGTVAPVSCAETEVSCAYARQCVENYVYRQIREGIDRVVDNLTLSSMLMEQRRIQEELGRQ